MTETRLTFLVDKANEALTKETEAASEKRHDDAVKLYTESLEFLKEAIKPETTVSTMEQLQTKAD